MDDPLSSLLKSLNIQVGLNKVAQRPGRRIEDLVAGQEQLTSFGAVFLIESETPYGSSHGAELISQEVDINLMHEWAGVHAGLSELLFFDTETTGLSGGTGTLAFLIGYGYFSDRGFVVRQLFLRPSDPEPAQLVEFSRALEGKTCLVSYNGKAFDAPILKNRLVINKLPAVFDGLQHIDMLHLARSIWKLRLESRGLKDLEREILHFERDTDEVPGWMIPEVYADYLRRGEIDNIPGVISHNRLDVLSLAAVYLHAARLLSDPQCWAASPSLDQYSLARILQKIGRHGAAGELYDLSVASGLNASLTAEAYLRKAWAARNQENWLDYEQYCQQAAALDSEKAVLELAIYAEHKKKDYEMALKYGQWLLARAGGKKAPLANKKKETTTLEKRIERIQQKIKKSRL